MANWNDIKASVGRVANKTTKKAGELADTASLHFKYKTCKAKVSEKFEKLGRLTYKQLKTEISYEYTDSVPRVRTLARSGVDLRYMGGVTRFLSDNGQSYIARSCENPR